MPKIVMFYDPKAIKLEADQLKEIGRHMSFDLARVMSTKDRRLSSTRDIDFIPTPYPDGYIGLPVAIEIEAIGYFDVKSQVTELMVMALKRKFIELLKQNGVGFDDKNPLIWIKYVDPEGPRV